MTRLPKISRVLTLAAVVALAGTLLHAQDGPPPGPPPGDMQGGPQHGPGVDRQLKRLTKLLSLTDDQQAKVKVILTDEHAQIKALFDQARSSNGTSNADAGGPPSPETMSAQRTQMRLIRDAANSKIAAMLTDTQKATFTAYLDQQKKREARQGDDMPPPPPDGDGGPPPDGGGPPSGGGGPPPGI